jgi:hypothetical protein
VAVARFRQAREDTARWCTGEGRRSSLRTMALRPDVAEWRPTQAEFDAALARLREVRLSRSRSTTGSIEAGRLLVCEVNESVASGEPEVASAGFFDLYDRPPWDTWFWRLETTSEPEDITLVSWVPNDLEAVVTQGIEVHFSAGIYWLDEQPFSRPATESIQVLLRAGFR